MRNARTQSVLELLEPDLHRGGVDPADPRAEIIAEILGAALTGAADALARPGDEHIGQPCPSEVRDCSEHGRERPHEHACHHS